MKNHAEVAKTTESRSPVSTWPNRGFIRVEGTNPSSLGFGWPGLKMDDFREFIHFLFIVLTWKWDSKSSTVRVGFAKSDPNLKLESWEEFPMLTTELQ